MTLNSLAQTLLAPVSDAWFGRLQYLKCQGCFPNLRHPRTFNEKIQWLKAHHHDPLLKECADKFTVRQYVKDRVGAEHLIPLIAVYDHPSAINFGTLPQRFVLKASHGSGWNILCRDISTLDIAKTRSQLEKWSGMNFYKVGREWCYDGLVPRIVCEEFMADSNDAPPWDYKFFCYHGTPHFVQVDHARFSHHTRSIYDVGWNRIPCQLEYALEPHDCPRPETLPIMLDIAAQLSRPFPFVRVDLYELDRHVLFGELTFYPGKGVERFTPRSYDLLFGNPLKLEECVSGKPTP